MRSGARRAGVWAAPRIAVAALVLAAIVTQFAVTVSGAAAADRDVATTSVNFFSFFTILSNAAAVIALLWGAIQLVGRRESGLETPVLALMLAATSTYMIVTGIVYNTLLRGIPLPQGTTVWWSNEVLHVIGPLFLLADVLFAPERRPLGWRAVWVVLGFPLLWVAYTLIRGPLVTNPVSGTPWWYPYPFLDPHSSMSGGYGGVTLYVGGIAIGIALVAIGILWMTRRACRQGAQRG